MALGAGLDWEEEVLDEDDEDDEGWVLPDEEGRDLDGVDLDSEGLEGPGREVRPSRACSAFRSQ